MAKYSDTEIAEAKERLSFLKPGQTIYTKRLHTARSGMLTVVGLYVGRGDAIRDISRDVAIVSGAQFDLNRWGVRVGGWGTDPGFSAVYSFGRSFYGWGEGPCTGHQYSRKAANGVQVYGCPSNDHVNPGPDQRKYRKGRKHADSGYTFRQSWL